MYIGHLIQWIMILAGGQVSRVILGKQLKLEGFTAFRWYEQWPTAFKEMAQWIEEVSVC